ncbi:hypothetical protein [Hymenobacter sp. BT190]|uniref:hypothetical protein n=1 Tax=Hymenobacter sp. BT190 TaxID=2763505 RepID=UPI0016516AC8|nr:hypothetical protein [Hymenobacter sp. BT190]MBC6698773.1 hypothetical protein [Hymenobacter sp. BT190]
MRSAHTRVLTKLLATGFYRQHTGLLLSLFVFIFSNFFYTNVLNQSHLTPEQLLETALKLVLSTVSEPLGVFLFAVILFVYSAKTRQYVGARLQAPDTSFVFYSLNALSMTQQLQAWAAVQLSLLLPVVALGGYAMVVGAAYGYWLVPLLIPVYLLALNVFCAWHYVGLTNRLTTKPARSAGVSWLHAWPKPLWSLFLFEVLVRKRVAYAVTKATSFAGIALVFSVFPGSHSDPRLIGLVGLCVALSHAVLIYQASEFELTYLRFARNFPYSKGQLYGQQAALYSLLLLPELGCLVVATAMPKALAGFLLLLSVTLLFRAVLYRIGQHIKQYLQIVFGLFLILLFADLFGLTTLLAVSSFLAAWVLLCRHSYAE